MFSLMMSKFSFIMSRYVTKVLIVFLGIIILFEVLVCVGKKLCINLFAKYESEAESEKCFAVIKKLNIMCC